MSREYPEIHHTLSQSWISSRFVLKQKSFPSEASFLDKRIAPIELPGKMSETIKSDAGQDSSAAESTKSNLPDNAGAPSPNAPENAIQEKSAVVEKTEPLVTNDAKDQIDPPTKEISVLENAAISVVSPESKDAVEPPKEDTSMSKASEREQSEQPPVIPEARQTIGAGDTCRLKENVNGDAKKLDAEITDAEQVSLPSEKSSMDNSVKAGGDEISLAKLKEEVQKISQERDSYRKNLGNAEKKLAALQASYDALLKGEGDEVMLRRMVDQLKSKLIQTSLQLEDRTRTVTHQEKQINALNSQVASLKEVESLTKSLLQIRNMEVKHLQTEVDDMESRITEERERYNTMINKMDAAVKLNADLKKEYETQLCLFRDLREKYEEKVTLLSEEKRALENNIQAVPK